MNIETKFNIGDLVQYKFQKPITRKQNLVCAFEIIEIHTNCCYTTAQVFYETRAIHAVIEESRDKDFKKLFSISDFGPGYHKDKEYCRFREDEIKMCDEELKKQITQP